MPKIIKSSDRSFYINKRNYIESESVVSATVCGFFSGRAIKPGIGVVREFGVAVPVPNLITDLGLDALGTAPGFTFMHLGTGTTPPDVSDTSLSNFGVSIANSRSTSSSGASQAAPYYGWTRITWTAEAGSATGVWTEIGVSNQAVNGNLRSRALILDSVGNPVAFPVLEGEQFQGTYEFRNYIPTEDALATINIGSNSYESVTRAMRATQTSGNTWIPRVSGSNPLFFSGNGSFSYTGDLADITAQSPSGGSGWGTAASQSTAPYESGTHRRDMSFRWGPGSSGNSRTFGLHAGSAALQVQLDPVISKLTTEEVIHNQRISWARR